MKRGLFFVALAAFGLATLLGVGTMFSRTDVANAKAEEVRWDIIHLIDGHITAGGVAFAKTANPATLQIKLTGSGTFVAPASGGTSSAVTGGGTWETFGPTGTSTGSGDYKVTKLVSWEFANFQTRPNPNPANIGVENERANGNAVLLIEYEDGSTGAISHGILGIACHGPGSLDGIHEGVIASKDFVTYWSLQLPPAGGVDANRTLFHVHGKP